MSVALHTEDFTVLDERKYLNQVFGPRYSACPLLFAIEYPFLMDSQARGQAISGIISRKRKKRRRVTEQVDSKFLEICQSVECVHKKLLACAQAKLCLKGTMTDVAVVDNFNNTAARECAKASCQQFCTEIVLETVEQLRFQGTETEHNAETMKDAILQDNCTVTACKLYSNPMASKLSIKFGGAEYLMPENSKFYLGTAKDGLSQLVKQKCTFDLIVIDPPWENKSVKRKKSYNWDYESNLVDLPVHDLLCEGGVVAVWTTNNARQMDTARRFAGRWGKVVACARWLKVTTNGDPVCSFLAHHKVPFENVLLIVPVHLQVTVPNDLVFCSVPCAIPSSKPHLIDVLQSMGLVKLKQGHCSMLDVFGRTLLPNCCSVGYEAIKFNRIDENCLQCTAD